MKFKNLNLLLDPKARTGPDSMAIDEWLLNRCTHPVLRVYRWKGEWGSVGYFDRLVKAQSAFPDIKQWVRRWTGGGTVDHRRDWAYTLIIPTSATEGRRLRGAESYEVIHQALAEALESEGLDLRLSSGNEMTGAPTCFDNPVAHDLVNEAGEKLAGAGQRRSTTGMMHQGSVALPLDDNAAFEDRAKRLADSLSDGQWTDFMQGEISEETIRLSSQQRYADPAWTERRM